MRRRGNMSEVESRELLLTESLRVVKNHTQSVSMSTAHATDTVTQIHAIYTSRTLHWPMVNREDHSVALPERHDFRPGLHARPLFRDHEFTAGEIPLGL